MRSVHFAVALTALLAGCASGGTGSGVPSTNTTVTARGTVKRTNIISTQEINASGASNALQLVRGLRPTWSGSYKIFIGESEYAGALSDLAPSDYKEIRYYTPSEAQMKFVAVRGTQAGSGLLAAIQLIKR